MRGTDASHLIIDAPGLQFVQCHEGVAWALPPIQTEWADTAGRSGGRKPNAAAPVLMVAV